MMSSKILKGPKLKSRIPLKTMGQIFFECAEKYSDRICQVDGTLDKSETYASVKLRSIRVALELQKKGITSSDVIVFCTGNSMDTVIPILATFYLGAKVANLDTSLSTRQMEHLLSLAKPKVVFVAESAVDLIEESLKEIGFKIEIIVYGESTKYTQLSELTTPKDGENSFKPTETDLHDTALLFFSSGTTGLPKAICHSHYSFNHIGCMLLDYSLGNAVLHFNSFYWITAMFIFTYTHMAGASRVFCQSVESQNIFKVVEKYKVETMFLAPVLINKFTNEQADKYDTSSLRLIHCAGTPLSSSQYEKMVSLFKHTKVVCIYGMTEAGPISGFHPDTDKDFIRTKLKSCGKPFPSVKIKIVSQENTDEILAPNEKGEIRMKSPGSCSGYYNIDSSPFDKDGFVKSGDIGYYDEDGCIYIIGRTKEMFKYQSWHIVPSHVESILLEHPAVMEAAVFGVPCGDDGEAPGACIVLKEDFNVTKEEIFDFAATKMSDREKLRGGITFVSRLPKTPTGKLIREQIRDSVLKNS